MRSKFSLRHQAAIVAATVALVSCAGDESESSDVLGTVSGHAVVLEENAQGSDAPCVGVEVQASGATTATVACPTLPAEERQYAAVVEVESEVFVVGFGLADGETIVDDQFIDVFVSSEVEGRRFFAAQVTDGHAVDAVTISDGSMTRELQTV